MRILTDPVLQFSNILNSFVLKLLYLLQHIIVLHDQNILLLLVNLVIVVPFVQLVHKIQPQKMEFLNKYIGKIFKENQRKIKYLFEFVIQLILMINLYIYHIFLQHDNTYMLYHIHQQLNQYLVSILLMMFLNIFQLVLYDLQPTILLDQCGLQY